MNNQR